MSSTLSVVPLWMGSTVRAGGVAVAPIFSARPPRARYLTLDEAVPLGVRITEVHEDGVVRELRVENGTPENVLLYDGEELLGAMQNRILDVSVLVEAGTDLPIPVSCVEQGRWSPRSAAFQPARHASNPEVRRRKARRLARAGVAAGSTQSEVWSAVAETAGRLGVESPTGAQADLFAERRGDLEDLARLFPVQDGQVGAVLALAGRPVCLDLLSRPEAFARLYPKLLAGYLVDGLDRPRDGDPSDTAIARFIAATIACAVRQGPGVGLGEDLRLTGDGVLGSGLALDGEVIQLSAYNLPAE